MRAASGLVRSICRLRHRLGLYGFPSATSRRRAVRSPPRSGGNHATRTAPIRCSPSRRIASDSTPFPDASDSVSAPGACSSTQRRRRRSSTSSSASRRYSIVGAAALVSVIGRTVVPAGVRYVLAMRHPLTVTLGGGGAYALGFHFGLFDG